MNIRFIIISFVLFTIVLASEYTAYASLRFSELISPRTEKTIMILGVILPIIFIISMIYGYKNYSSFNSLLNTISAVWIGLVIYTLIASLLIFVLIMINTYSGSNIPIKLISQILITLVLITVSYGIINAANPRVVKWEINSAPLSLDWQNKKIVMISDVHLGQIRGEKFFRKVISKINKENPDVVFILGDLIDGSAFPYEKWLGELSAIKPSMGIIYIEGNHEKYNQEYEKFKSEIPDYVNNITDKKIISSNTQIIGLDYKQAETGDEIKSRLESLGYNKEEPSIILVHDPKNIKALSEEKVSLVLSGHTHGGQLFPFTSLVNYIYKKYTHGVTQTNMTTSVTSYGVGTSIIPMRIGTTPEIVVLKIK